MNSSFVRIVTIVFLAGALAYHARVRAGTDALRAEVASRSRVAASMPAVEREHEDLLAVQLPESTRARLRADHEALERLRREVQQLEDAAKRRR